MMTPFPKSSQRSKAWLLLKMRIAIIPARGGSKRIPRKNIREFHGKPMIAWSIQAALNSGCFDRVIVSTDCREIGQVSRDFGAETPFIRPPELSDDFTPTAPVIAHAINSIEKDNFKVKIVCCIYATAPLIQPSDLKLGLDVMHGGDWKFAFSGTVFDYPVYRSFERDLDGSIRMLFPQHYKVRSQDLPEVWHDAGQFYWGKPDSWRNSDPIFAPHSTVVPLPGWRVQDIDSEEDWKKAEIIARIIMSEQPEELK